MFTNPVTMFFVKCNRDVNTENHPARPEIASSIVSNTYESIPNTTTEFHEPTHDPNGTVDHHNAIEAYDNPIYA